NANPSGITAGSDGNIWFVEQNISKIARSNTSGNITEFAVTTANSGPFRIAAGPDGNLWFTELLAAGDRLGRATTSGGVSEFPLPAPDEQPKGIAMGPDGNVWFTAGKSNAIGKIVP